MRILEEDKEKQSLSIHVQNIDDLWYIHNIITPGDRVRMVVLRRQDKQDDMTRSKEQSRKPMLLTVEVSDVEFQEFSSKIKVLGTIVEGKEGLIGEHQSFMIGTEDTFELIKAAWSDEQKEMLREGSESTFGQGYCFVGIDDEEASVFILRSYGIQGMGKVSAGKSGKDYETHYSEKEYLLEVIKTIRTTISPDIPVIVLGAGFTREKLVNMLKSDPAFSGRQIFSYATARSDEGGIYEFLSKEESEKIFSASRMVNERKLLEQFFKNLKTNDLSVYGKDAVKEALKTGAVEDLIMTEEKFRSNESRELLELAKNFSSRVHIFSVHDDSGLSVKKFGGYCAILRFPMPKQ
ncbi:hypothetical protein IX51_02810 [uncultured archaeon]|nr:hypothetical protein IX51_02810 [uncultured archaeon]HKJ96974.1 hypothetical protein [Thermoplasmataceae archaeon]